MHTITIWMIFWAYKELILLVKLVRQGEQRQGEQRQGEQRQGEQLNN
jgi:hypothetical protein